ncbi:MAG: MbcA/ParS/Xre antitoxin family protein, partial [Desulfuromonadaceae bacterium]|nr:MbcA/ParS/Xre antitoxin family protein [Desulfuromonadaceae bacterium]
RNGEALPESRDTLDRVGWLMAIHKALGLLYPYNEDVRYSWVTRRNKAFDNLTPLDVMREQGIIGIARVSRYLDHYRGL